MNQEKICAIENELMTRSIELEFTVEDDDKTYFTLPDTQPLQCTPESIAEIILGGTLNEDFYSVDMVKFPSEGVTALIFNQGMASGRYELMGITQGLNPSPNFIRKSMIRWTEIENFQWPKKIDVNFNDLLPQSLILELYAINKNSE